MRFWRLSITLLELKKLAAKSTDRRAHRRVRNSSRGKERVCSSGPERLPQLLSCTARIRREITLVTNRPLTRLFALFGSSYSPALAVPRVSFSRSPRRQTLIRRLILTSDRLLSTLSSCFLSPPPPPSLATPPLRQCQIHRIEFLHDAWKYTKTLYCFFFLIFFIYTQRAFVFFYCKTNSTVYRNQWQCRITNTLLNCSVKFQICTTIVAKMGSSSFRIFIWFRSFFLEQRILWSFRF